MGPTTTPDDAARTLAARLTEHLARTNAGAVVEATVDEVGRPAVELRWFGAGGPTVRAPRVRWTVDPEHAETQFRDLVRRIELLRAVAGPHGTPDPAGRGPGWCEWE